MIIAVITASPAYPQGSIFGSVTNSDASIPDSSAFSFFGYLDDTDEEISIESSIGAGYNEGNWYDDFQNYLTEAPGNPYDYHFYNSDNGEGYILSGLIPNNSFQQEDIVLAQVSWPAKPGGLDGRTISSGKTVVFWDETPGLACHVFRRPSTSNGSFFRKDDTAGSLLNLGVSDSFYIDSMIDSPVSFNYLIIAEDSSGNLSPHSDIIEINSAAVDAPVITAVYPSEGHMSGGTEVRILGVGFDNAGVVATIGGIALNSVTVITPFEITGITPPGSPGPIDIIVTNIASTLPSEPLIDGFNYLSNQPPVLDLLGHQTVPEGGHLSLPISASDPDGVIPEISASNIPLNASMTDNGDGTGQFTFDPDYTQAGYYSISFYATDGIDADSEVVVITVTNTNRAPEIDSIGPFTVVEYSSLNFILITSDPDGTDPQLTAEGLPDNAEFIDNGNGNGSFVFNPDQGQAGEYHLIFRASDEPDEGPEALTDSLSFIITVTSENRPPQPVWPVDDEVILDHSPTIDWTDVIGTDSYELEVDNSPGFNTVDRRLSAVISEKTVSPDLAIGVWYWRVRAHYISGWSDWSVATVFRICNTPSLPVLVRPVNGSDDVARPVNFDWNDVGGAAVYHLNVRMATIIIDTLLDVSSFSLTGLDENTAYYWKVRVLSTCDLWSDWSAEWNFTTECPTPEAPNQVKPNNGDTVTQVVLVWNASVGATNYQLMIDDHGNFSAPELDTTLADLSVITETLADTTEYFWRVRAENHCGWGTWSPVWSFRTSQPTDVNDQDQPQLPNRLALSQNYPNPFNPVTTIEFSLPHSGYVSLDVFDIVGRKVTTLVADQMSAGVKKIIWNGIDSQGRAVASGVYFYRLRQDDIIETRKMILTK
ncbi:MAG: T9SS type A sorting domain-containing protein [FCB group bacterium]|nr:T9SS type A sorting domain-containing protein [FCB group bacterium]